jgi:type II secretory ATPase GspE/PulE/Tfp pilus assembly ATPase PilB-like protein
VGLFGKKKPTRVVRDEPPIKFEPAVQLPEFDENMDELYFNTRVLVATALKSRCQTMLLALSNAGVALTYQIDGVTHPAPGLDRATGGNVMAMLKLVAGIDPAQPKPQSQGKFVIYYLRKKFTVTLQDRIAKDGEQMALVFDDGAPPPGKFDETGMRPGMIDRIRELTQGDGFFLVSAPPKHGFTTLFNCSVRHVDRYLRNVVAVEDVNADEHETENAPITTYNAKSGESPANVLPTLLRTYPDVVCVRKMENADTVNLLLEQPAQQRLVIAGVIATDAVEALLRVIAMKCSREKFAKTVTAVLGARLLRRLCDVCKQAYAPPPQLLQQLGIPAGKIQAFYRPGPPPLPPDYEPDPTQPPPVCPKCNGIGYYERAGIFELLEVNDDLRKALTKTNSLEELRKIAKAGGHNGLMEEGVATAARGLTSIQEVIRVLKG